MNATAYMAREVLTKQGKTELQIHTWANFNPRQELITTVNHKPFSNLDFRHSYKACSIGERVNVYAITGWKKGGQ